MKKMFSGLVLGRGGTTLSVGRSLLLLSFTVQLFYWILPLTGLRPGLTAPASLMEVIDSLLIYEGFKKGRDVADRYLKTPGSEGPAGGSNVQ